MSLGRSEFADGVAARSLSEISEVDAVRIGADIVSAARRLISLLRSVGDCQWLHHPPVIAEAIRRYDELWMPLISDLTVGSKPPMILPPLDVEWVWFCHSLNPVSYRDYCLKKFSKLIGKPAIYDEENEDYAVLQCEKIWVTRYPEESFENRADPDSPEPVSSSNEDIKTEVEKQRFLWEKFSAPYMSESVYLIAARLRYKGFLLILHKFKEEITRLLPASDILLMWLTHQSYPTIYTEDVDEMLEEIMRKVVRYGETVEKSEVETTKKLWNRYFNQPYEKAGGELTVIPNESRLCNNTVFYWPVSDVDVNTSYKSIRPRFVLELCIFIRLNPKAELNESSFLRLRVGRCHRKLQLDKKMTNLSRDGSWEKGWHLYCEFGTQGVVLESHCDRPRGICFRSRKPEGMIAFLWNDLLRAHSLSLGRFLGKQVSVFASVTPPVQAPYLLRFVPDRATDDSGAMISDSIQRTNNFRPQEGRWLTRTVLDHAGRECFVIRIRVGKGVFKRGSEVPSPVKSEERITEIRVGSWSYVEGSIGKAPAKVVGTVIPKEAVENWESAWEFSTGDELLIRWNSSGSISELGLRSRNPGSLAINWTENAI
ncbi:glycine-rich domain-containing protein 1 isoform X2 [Eutrema salsugineum]|uniref:glycine-rich domain-containing protein 1 isoform X2 n=1 Tax=Eutrema salsugineum TaxID=72664 RepID=UPI000CED708F|nr:glycine-rich domain-containing protein 1 isoform X2 [Eutrema salsugineum]